jgi:hypothetical protein
MEETFRKMTHAFEKYVIPNFPSHEIDARTTTHNSSAINGHSQTQPSYYMSMNTYVGQPHPPPPI